MGQFTLPAGDLTDPSIFTNYQGVTIQYVDADNASHNYLAHVYRTDSFPPQPELFTAPRQSRFSITLLD
jgi:hypothetical protein